MFRWLSSLIEVWTWLRIVASPTIFGLILGGLVYYFFPNEIGILIWMVLALVGLILGIIWATKIWKKEGTSFFLFRINGKADTGKK